MNQAEINAEAESVRKTIYYRPDHYLYIHNTVVGKNKKFAERNRCYIGGYRKSNSSKKAENSTNCLLLNRSGMGPSTSTSTWSLFEVQVQIHTSSYHST